MLMINRNTLILTEGQRKKTIELNKNMKNLKMKMKMKFKLKLKSINEYNSYDTNEDFNDFYYISDSYLNKNKHQNKNKSKYLNEYNQYSLTLIFIDFIKDINNKLKENFSLLMSNLHMI
jgi:hypothetical protein